MRAITCLLLTWICYSCNSSGEKTEVTRQDTATSEVSTETSFQATAITAKQIPETITYEGEVKYVYQWADSLGDNVFFVTAKAPYPDRDKGEAEEEGKSADLYAYHYVKGTGDDYALTWKMHDGEISCPFDITTDVIPGSVTVTDLDKNGIAEIKFQYALACRSDVSPAEMKLVMEENKKVYTLNGNRWVEFSPEFKFDVNASNVNLEKLPMLDDGEDDLLRSYGRYKTEKDFASAPPAFIEYARNEWLKYVIEKF